MKKVIFLFYSFFQLVMVSAQVNMVDSSVFVIPQWKVGEKTTYSCTYVSQSVMLANEKESNKTNNLDVTILQDDGDSYVVEIFEYNILENGEKKDFRKTFDYYDNLKMVVRFDKNGHPIELVNFKQVQKFFQQKHKQTKAYWSAYPQLKPILDAMDVMYDSQEHLENVLFRNSWIYDVFSFYGKKFVLNQSQIQKDDEIEKKQELIGLSLNNYTLTQTFVNTNGEDVQIAIECDSNGCLNKYVRVSKGETSISTHTYKKLLLN